MSNLILFIWIVILKIKKKSIILYFKQVNKTLQEKQIQEKFFVVSFAIFTTLCKGKTYSFHTVSD